MPARGRLLVKAIETAETLNGGRIFLTENTREGMVMGQYEVVAIGDPERCEDETCEHPHVECFGDQLHPIDERLQIGSWILVTPRSAIDADALGYYFVNSSDVIGIFA